MLIHEGDQRAPTADLILGASLAFVAGGVNSAGYLAYNFFSANMTGNVSIASEFLTLNQPSLALSFAVIVLTFIFGSFAASLLIEFGKAHKLQNVYALTLIIEASILVAASFSLKLTSNSESGVVLVSLLSFTMGIQNAASTRISGSRIRTTHVSGAATDLGVGLAILLTGSQRSEKAALVQRLKLYSLTIICFGLGGVAGVISHKLLSGMSFSLFSLPLIAMSAKYLWSRKSSVGK